MVFEDTEGVVIAWLSVPGWGDRSFHSVVIAVGLVTVINDCDSWLRWMTKTDGQLDNS